MTGADGRQFIAQAEAEVRALEDAARVRNHGPAAAPRILYHYTTLAGLQGIVETNAMWATDTRYFNDAKEFTYSKEVIETALRECAAKVKDEGEKEMLLRCVRTFDS